MDSFDIIRTLKWLPGIIIGLTIHEFSHAYIADKCGDPTSKEMGRVSLNPFKHIDWIGFLLLLVAGFGWAKPVQFDERRLRNPHSDIMKIAVAGPVSNAGVAIVISWIFALIIKLHPQSYYSVLSEVLIYAIYINWGLFIFNLIPIPPLDGSHLLLNYFRKYPSLYAALYKYGTWLLFLLILVSFAGRINLLPIWPVIRFLGDGLLHMMGVNI